MIGRILPNMEEARRLRAIEVVAFGPRHQSWSAESYISHAALPGTAILAEQESMEGFVVVSVAGEEGEILNLAVHPAAQRTGHGRALMDAAEDWAARRGAAAMFLEVALDAVPARQLYARLGYSMVGRRRAYYARVDAPRVDALVLMKTLERSD